MMLKISLSLLVSFLFLTDLFAQDRRSTEQATESDSLIAIAMAEHAALMYPKLRQFTITHEENAFGQITSAMHGNRIFEGKFRTSRTHINMNVPIMQRANDHLIGSLGVIHQFYDLHDVRNYDAAHVVYDQRTYIPMMSAALTYMHKDSLFGRPVNYMAHLSGIFDPSMSRAQLTFTGMANFVLRQTANSRLTAGAVLVLDPASPVPFFLMLNYFRRFENLNMYLMIDLPYRLALRKAVKERTSFTFFNELQGSNSFFKFSDQQTTLTNDYTFSNLEIKSGLMAEYRLTKKAVFSLSTGVNYAVNSRIREGSAKPNDYFIKNKHQAVPFVQVGISLLPFWKGVAL